jgi:5-methylcytosine-specific restriction enzyme A
VASGIRAAAEIVRESEKSNWLAEEKFPEGQILTRLHLIRERKRSSAKGALSRAAEAHALKCEICDFDFRRRYGRLGEQYIECHDVVPLDRASANLKPDLVLVCSNCHRMVHRARPWLGRAQLSSIVI